MDALKHLIRDIPDFPQPGILFRDITTLLRDPAGLRKALDHLIEPHRDTQIDQIVGIESRGFILGAAMADRLGVGFVPVRKPGKLPAATVSAAYELEYGTDALEMHRDAINEGHRVLIVDDLLATGGTARAATQLVRECGGEVVGLAFLIELAALNGRAQLPGEQLFTVIRY